MKRLQLNDQPEEYSESDHNGLQVSMPEKTAMLRKDLVYSSGDSFDNFSFWKLDDASRDRHCLQLWQQVFIRARSAARMKYTFQ